MFSAHERPLHWEYSFHLWTCTKASRYLFCHYVIRLLRIFQWDIVTSYKHWCNCQINRSPPTCETRIWSTTNVNFTPSIYIYIYKLKCNYNIKIAYSMYKIGNYLMSYKKVMLYVIFSYNIIPYNNFLFS